MVVINPNVRFDFPNKDHTQTAKYNCFARMFAIVIMPLITEPKQNQDKLKSTQKNCILAFKSKGCNPRDPVLSRSFTGRDQDAFTSSPTSPVLPPKETRYTVVPCRKYERISSHLIKSQCNQCCNNIYIERSEGRKGSVLKARKLYPWSKSSSEFQKAFGRCFLLETS